MTILWDNIMMDKIIEYSVKYNKHFFEKTAVV